MSTLSFTVLQCQNHWVPWYENPIDTEKRQYCPPCITLHIQWCISISISKELSIYDITYIRFSVVVLGQVLITVV